MLRIAKDYEIRSSTQKKRHIPHTGTPSVLHIAEATISKPNDPSRDRPAELAQWQTIRYNIV